MDITPKQLKLKLSKLKAKLKLRKKLRLKCKRANKKAIRNSKKSFATTKSFNDKTNDFIPEINHVRNPDAVLYLLLKNKGKLPLSTKGGVITYKEWMKYRFDEVRRRI